MRTKTCSKCGDTKCIRNFHKCSRRKDKHQGVCKECNAKAANKNYHTNPDTCKEQSKRTRAKFRQKYLDLFKDKCCLDCGNTNPIVFELDHRDQDSKVMEVSLMVGRSSWKALLEEFEKCDIVCANCHRIRTAKRAGWLKASQ